jgi:GntR family transcriptional regulator
MAETKRARLAHDLRTAIAAMAPGERLPSEQDLARDNGVSRETVRAVLRDLVHEGLIRMHVGLAGAEVLDRSPLYRQASRRLAKQQRDANQGTHLAEASAVGRPSSVQTRIYFEFADEVTAKTLGIPAGEEVLVRDRVMSIGDQPTQLAVSRYPRAITQGSQIEQEDTGPGGVLSRFEDAGHTIARHIERVSVHRATPDEAIALQVPTATVCFRIIRTTVSATGQVLEVNTMTLADRYELVYEVPAE